MTVNFNKSTPANFELVFPVIPTGEGLRDMQGLTLNIYATVIPSMTLETTPINFLGGTAHMDVGGLTFEPWYVNFIVDSNYDNWRKIYKWINYINNNKDRFGRSSADYKIDATLRILDNYKNEVMVIDIIGLWANMLGEITLSSREGAEYLTSSANFMYDRYEVRTT